MNKIRLFHDLLTMKNVFAYFAHAWILESMLILSNDPAVVVGDESAVSLTFNPRTDH